MSLRDLLPGSEQLTYAEGVERELLRRRRKGALSGYAALFAAAGQIVFMLAQREDYLANIGTALLALTQLNLRVLLAKPEALGLLAAAVATVTWLLLRRTSFLMRESREPFRYTFWIEPFTEVADELPENVTVVHHDRLKLLHRDLTERLNQRIARRFSLLEPGKLNDEERAQLSSHVRIGGTFALRERPDGELTVHVMPHIGIGAAHTAEVLAEPVNYPLLSEKPGQKEVSISFGADRYNQLVERVYSSVATRIYDQIRSDVRQKIQLFPSGYLRAVAYFHEAQDFERSNTVDAYDHAIALYHEAKRYFETHKLERVTRVLSRTRVLWRIDRRFLHMEARTRIGYARCLIYRRLVSALSGRERNPLFEVQEELRSARDTLVTLFNNTSSSGQWQIRSGPERADTAELRADEATNRYNAFLAALAVPKDTLARRGSARFEATRLALCEAYTVSALAYAQLDAVQWARPLLELAAAVDPANGQDNPLWLLAAAEIEPALDQRKLLLRRATELAPTFEIAHYRHAWTAEMLLRSQNDISKERTQSVVYEYEHVLRVNPGNVGARAAQAYLCWLAGDLTQARKHYEAGLEIKATVSQTFVGDLTYGLARVLAESGDAVDANRSFTLYASALSADPGVGAYSATAGRVAAHTYYDFITPVVVARYRRFRRRVWQAYCSAAARKRTSIPERVAHTLYGYALNDYGNATFGFYWRLGDRQRLRRAVRALERGVDIDAENMVARYNLYNAYDSRSEGDDAERAVARLEEVVAALPTWLAPLTALSQKLVRTARAEVDRLQRELTAEREQADGYANSAELNEAEARRSASRGPVTGGSSSADIAPWRKAELRENTAAQSADEHAPHDAERMKKLRDELLRGLGRSRLSTSVLTRRRSRSDAASETLVIDSTTAAQRARAQEKKHRERIVELEDSLAREQAKLADAVSNARSVIGRNTRLSPLFSTPSDIRGRTNVPELLSDRMLRWERLDDSVVQALRSWAGIAADSGETDALLEAEQLCRQIVSRYYPDDFEAHFILVNTLKRRLQHEQDPAVRSELEEKVEKCRQVIRFAISYWETHDPIHFMGLNWFWHEDYFNEAERLVVLQRAVQERRDDPAYCARVAELWAAPARDLVSRGKYDEAIQQFKRAMALCSEQVRYPLELADAWEVWRGPDRRIEELDVALTALDAAAKRGAKVPAERMRKLRRARAVAQHAGPAVLEREMLTTPIALEVSADLVPIIASDAGSLLEEVTRLVEVMRSEIQQQLGVRVPGVIFRGNSGDLPIGTYIISLFEVPIVMGTVVMGSRLFPGDAGALEGHGIPALAATNPVTGGPGAWVSGEHIATLNSYDLPTWSPVETMMRHLEAVLRVNLAEFVGHQEVTELLQRARIDRQIRDSVELSQLVMVLRSLLCEGASITPLLAITAEFQQLRAQGRSLLEVSEAVRMIPAVRWSLPGNDDRGRFLRLSAQFEAQLQAALHRTGDAVVLAIEPTACQDALTAIREHLSGPDDTTIVVDSPELRPFVRKLIELEWPRTPVLSAAELKPRLRTMAVQEIALEAV
jgi:tetratricopeptide (TPR) repeat protein